MRSSSETEIIVREDGVKVGVMLGANFCSEHEWGIDRLRQYCGGMSKQAVTENKVCDFSRIRIKVKPKDLIWYEEKGLAILAVSDNFEYYRNKIWNAAELKRVGLKEGADPIKCWAANQSDFSIPKKLTPKDKESKWPPKQTLSAWDEESFGISTREPEMIAFLEELKVAMLIGDAVLHVSSGNNPFKPVSGLTLAIESRVPQEQKDGFKAGYEDLFKLSSCAEKTGIAAKLEKAGKRYFALSPRWASDKDNSKHSVIFWLNPCEQQDNHSCWCTVEDLELWIKGEGPIPKKGKV